MPATTPTCVLEGIDEYRVFEPVYEAFRIVLTHLGAAYSPAYLQGLSGAAFRIAGICPCAPTVSTACKYEDLIIGLGYQIQTLSSFAAGTGHNSDNEFSDLMTTDDLAPLDRLDAAARPIHAAARAANAAIKDHVRARSARAAAPPPCALPDLPRPFAPYSASFLYSFQISLGSEFACPPQPMGYIVDGASRRTMMRRGVDPTTIAPRLATTRQAPAASCPLCTTRLACCSPPSGALVGEKPSRSQPATRPAHPGSHHP